MSSPEAIIKSVPSDWIYSPSSANCNCLDETKPIWSSKNTVPVMSMSGVLNGVPVPSAWTIILPSVPKSIYTLSSKP